MTGLIGGSPLASTKEDRSLRCVHFVTSIIAIVRLTPPSINIQNYTVPLERFPVFKRKGSIIPLQVFDSVTGSFLHWYCPLLARSTSFTIGNGDKRAVSFLTLLVSQLGASEAQSVRQYMGPSQEFAYAFDDNLGLFELKATAHDRRLIFLFRGVLMKPASTLKVVALTSNAIGSAVLPEFSVLDEVTWAIMCCLPMAYSIPHLHTQRYGVNPGWYYDAKKLELWVQPGATTQGLQLTIHGMTNAPHFAC